MDQYAILLGYFDKQLNLIEKLYKQVKDIDLAVYEKRYVFSMKVQQLYTAIEDLLKQIAKAFENHIEDLSSYHKGILLRLNTAIPNIRPAAISEGSFLFLDKLRTFRHFIRHAYDVELDEKELRKIQEILQNRFPSLVDDLMNFRKYVEGLS